MRFAIRDDDASFYTRPEELERVWSDILPYAPVSLAVVPFSVESFHPGDVRRFYQGSDARALKENRDLVSWLRERLAGGNLSVMCHGYTHEYRRIGPMHLDAEYIWKPYDRLCRETREGKQHLESTLGCTVDTFVPPGNSISREGLEAVRMSYSKIMTTLPLRRVQDLRLADRYLSLYAKRLYYQVRYGMANPFGEDMHGLKLIPSVSVTQQASWEGVRDKLLLCHRLNANFVAAVHYWEIDRRLKDVLLRLLDLAQRLNCEFQPCSRLFTPPDNGLQLRPARI
jgi:hypothetical protein